MMIRPTIYLAAVALPILQLWDEETIDAPELVARCADAGGVLTLHTDLRVVGGAALTGACRIILDFSRLAIESVQLSASGFFMIDGQPGGELRIERSTLTQSCKEGLPVNILLRAHHLTVDSTAVNFEGSIHLETGMGDRGVMQVGSTILRSGSEDVKVGASGAFEEGSSEIRSSIMVAATDINISASFSLRGGVVDVEGSSRAARSEYRPAMLGKPEFVGMEPSEQRRPSPSLRRATVKPESRRTGSEVRTRCESAPVGMPTPPETFSSAVAMCKFKRLFASRQRIFRTSHALRNTRRTGSDPSSTTRASRATLAMSTET